MAPAQSKITQLPYDPVDSPCNAPPSVHTGRIVKRKREPATTLDAARTMPAQITDTATSRADGASDAEEDYGQAIGFASRGGRVAMVRATFDIKRRPEDYTHYDGEDEGDDFLRDFIDQITLPTGSSTSDHNDAASLNMFFGFHYMFEGAKPYWIMATLVRNREGHWIGENVEELTHDNIAMVNIELPMAIWDQIEKVDKDEEAEEELLRREWEVREREKALKKRERAVRKLEKRVNGRKK
jgi:hypothetical protein